MPPALAPRARPAASAPLADAAAHDLKGDALHPLWGAEEMLLAEPHDTRRGDKNAPSDERSGGWVAAAN
jgi:hypothetical protein